jgi:hypothetical protein
MILRGLISADARFWTANLISASAGIHVQLYRPALRVYAHVTRRAVIDLKEEKHKLASALVDSNGSCNIG